MENDETLVKSIDCVHTQLQTSIFRLSRPILLYPETCILIGLKVIYLINVI